MAILPLYKPDYKKWLLELKHKDEDHGDEKLKVVYIEKTPSAGLVPPRIIKENKAQDFEAPISFTKDG